MWLTSVWWGCPLENGPKLAVRQPDSSLKKQLKLSIKITLSNAGLNQCFHLWLWCLQPVTLVLKCFKYEGVLYNILYTWTEMRSTLNFCLFNAKDSALSISLIFWKLDFYSLRALNIKRWLHAYLAYNTYPNLNVS